MTKNWRSSSQFFKPSFESRALSGKARSIFEIRQCKSEIASLNFPSGEHCFNWSKDQIGKHVFSVDACGKRGVQGKGAQLNREVVMKLLQPTRFKHIVAFFEFCALAHCNCGDCFFEHSITKALFQLIERADWRVCLPSH